MSKRITLTDEDIELLVILIRQAANAIKPYNNIELMAIQRQNQLLSKLKTEPSSQKASSDSIASSIPQEDSHDEK